MHNKKILQKNKLAFLGGSKTISNHFRHYTWPPKSRKKTQSVVSYLKTEGLKGEGINKYGFSNIVDKFEKKFKKIFGMKYSLSTNSGTSAIHASLFSLGVKKGDEVIAPAITFHATATPILKLNAKPVFCDCESETGNICPKDIERKITKKTKVIIITHLCGHPCEMDKIMRLVKRKKIFLIEDCSHAHFSKYKGKKVGTFGDIGLFSMNRHKLLSAGEGGILITNKKFLFERALLVTDFGPRIQNTLSLNSTKIFKESGFGYKHRMHPVAAAIAIVELDNLKKYIRLRHKKLNYFSKKLKNIPGIRPPITKKYVHRGAYYSYRPFYIKEELNNLPIEKFIKALRLEGLEARRSGNLPLHLLPYFKFFKSNKKLKNSEKFYNTTISFPTFTFERLNIINLYVKAIKKVCMYYSKKKNV